MLSVHPTTMAGRWKAAAPSIVGIEYPDSIIGAIAAAGHVNFVPTHATSAAVAA